MTSLPTRLLGASMLAPPVLAALLLLALTGIGLGWWAEWTLDAHAEAVGFVHRLIVIQIGVAVALVAALGWLVRRRVTARLDRAMAPLLDVLVRRAAGETRARAPLGSDDDLAAVGRATNDLFDEIDAAAAEASWQVDDLERERDRINAAFAELAGLQRALEEHANVTVTDLDGRITYVNDHFCRVTGYSREELIGQTHRLVNSGEHPPEFFATLWRTVAAGDSWHGEVCNRSKDGELRWFDTTIVPVADGKGRLSKYVAVRSDITARKRTELDLIAANRQHEALLDAADEVSIVFTDLDGTIRVFNRGAERMFGFAADEVVGRRSPVGLHVAAELEHRGRELSWQFEQEITGFDVLVERVRREGSERRDWTCVRKDGGTITVDLIVTSVFGPSGEIVGYLGVATDITDRRRTELELGQARERAEEGSRAKTEFLAVMSHEIRTPMNGVIGMASLLLGTELTDEQRDYVNAVAQSGESLLGIINDILDFSKVEAGRMTIERIEFDLPATLQTAVALVVPRAHEKGLAVDLDLTRELPVVVVGDPGRLRQVLLNLISNAVKFTERGHVRVSTSYQPMVGGIELSVVVEDSGIGIPADRLTSIFEPFEQADASTTRRFGGTGLGLAISRRLVEAMGGTMGVESTPGVGSTFWFRLPFALGVSRAAAPAGSPWVSGVDRASPVAEVAVAAARPVRRAAARRVLLVDPNPISQRVGRRLLEQAGCVVELARAADEAVAAASHGPYDLLIVDEEALGPSAASVLATLHGTQVGPLVALRTGMPPVPTLSPEFAGSVTRPFTFDVLTALLDRHCAASVSVA